MSRPFSYTGIAGHVFLAADANEQDEVYQKKVELRNPGSAITHGIALILAMVGTLPLLLKAAREPDHLHVIAMAVFMLSMILLYLASTVYHTFDVNGKVNRRLKKFDHMMISVLIAGSYTPICLIALHGRTGIVLCALVWAAAIGGILVKAFWINCPKWFSSVLYIAMGWLCVLAFHPLFSGSFTAGIWMVCWRAASFTRRRVIYSLKCRCLMRSIKCSEHMKFFICL